MPRDWTEDDIKEADDLKKNDPADRSDLDDYLGTPGHYTEEDSDMRDIRRLEPGEIVIQCSALDSLKRAIEHRIDRAKYYDEHSDTLSVFEDLLLLTDNIYTTAR